MQESPFSPPLHNIKSAVVVPSAAVDVAWTRIQWMDMPCARELPMCGVRSSKRRCT